MKFTEKQIIKMASTISQSEDEKCKNAIRMVSDALKKINYTDDGAEIRSYATESYSYTLDLRHRFTDNKITLLVQGSYANKTNISSESDVDVAVILESTFTTKYRSGVSDDDYGFSDGKFSVFDLKEEVQKALNQHFGYQGVERHDKCIKVTDNTYRVDADVVPAYRYRDYSNDYKFDFENCVKGIEIRPDSGGSIINYPEQHIKSGIAKNRVTNYNFKKCVRIIKNMREEMKNLGYTISPKISSFGLESLLWNVDISAYNKYPSILRYTFDEVLKYLVNNFSNFEKYTEINAIKPLFVDNSDLYSYQKYISDLNQFFDYDI